MAKAVKKKKKKKKSAAVLQREALLKFGMLNSSFIRKLRNTFLKGTDATQLWSVGFATGDPVQRKVLIKEDLADCFRSLFQVHESTPPAPPLPGTPTSATQLMASLITQTGWAEDIDGKVPVPAPWNAADEDQFRRYEVACAMNILMQAYSLFGESGGRPTWPPEKPGKD